MTLDERFGKAIAPNGRPVKDNFLRWFKGSKVVDAAGDPLVVYHGTLTDFSSFKFGRGEAQSHGFFFTTQEHVNGYLWSYLDQVKYQEVERPGDHFVMPMYLSVQNPMRVDTTGTGEWADPESENAAIAKAKALGHDGLVFTDADMGTTFYVAFKPSQIKSAIGNSGLFLIHSKSLCDAVSVQPEFLIGQAQAARRWLAAQDTAPATRPEA